MSTTSEKTSEGPIPACAGETVATSPMYSLNQADPRVCGGNGVMLQEYAGKWGRSPRVRGKPIIIRSFPGSRGPIPACAGETRIVGLGLAANGADPRVCGGNFK